MAVSVEQADVVKDAVPELRRPGRKSVSPELIPLFRAAAEDRDAPDDARLVLEEQSKVEAHPIAPARGIAIAAVLSVPIWAVILGVGYAALK